MSRKWSPAIGGMETYSLEITKALSRHVALETRVLPGRGSGYPPGPMALALFLVTTAIFLLRKAHRYDLIHFGDLVLFPLAWISSKRPHSGARVVTVHGLDLLFGRRSGLAPRIYRCFMGWAARRHAVMSVYITNSSNTAQLCEASGFIPATPIPLGVRLSGPLSTTPVPDRPPYLLFVGRLVPRKGAAWFADEILPALPEAVRLRIVGKGWDPRETRRLEQNPRVDLLGYLPDAELRLQRQHCAAVVMPNQPSPDGTDVEGFGIAALESAAAGVPIFASAVEGLLDAVRDGETGFLLPANDPAAWISALQDVLSWSDETRAAFAARAHASVAEHYSWERVARQTAACYAQVNAGSKRQASPAQ